MLNQFLIISKLDFHDFSLHLHSLAIVFINQNLSIIDLHLSLNAAQCIGAADRCLVMFWAAIYRPW